MGPEPPGPSGRQFSPCPMKAELAQGSQNHFKENYILLP